MASSSKFRNRQPDNRYVKAEDRYRLNDPQYTMAFATQQVQLGYRYSMTPSMLMVQPGSEFVTHVTKKLWNRKGTTTAAFKALLSHFAEYLLKPAGKQGYVDKTLAKLAQKNGYLWFLYPQVTGSSHNMSCTACHMPGSEGFSKKHFPNGNSPYHILHDQQKNTWYTLVNLGKDSQGKVVWEGAHAILGAARWGIPDAVFDTSLPVKDQDKYTPHALHTPCCPGAQGGCLNPLHLCWKLEEQNRKDQETKRSRRNRGPRAWGRNHHYYLVPD